MAAIARYDGGIYLRVPAAAAAPAAAYSADPTPMVGVGVGGGNAQSVLVELGKKLLEAARAGQAARVGELVGKGAPMTTDWLGNSPLHVAALNGHAECARLLLNAGCSRDARTKVEKTALHLACWSAQPAVVRLLLDVSADVHVVDMLNMTPLHWAVQSGCRKSVELLLRHSADINMENKFGKSPLEIASDRNLTDIFDMLMSADAYRESEVATRTITTQLNAQHEYEMTETITVPPSAHQEVTISSQGMPAVEAPTTTTPAADVSCRLAPAGDGGGVKKVAKIQAVQIKQEPGAPNILTVKGGVKIAPAAAAAGNPTRLIRFSPGQANNFKLAGLNGQKVMLMPGGASPAVANRSAPIKIVRVSAAAAAAVGAPQLRKGAAPPQPPKKTVTMLPAVVAAADECDDRDRRKRKLAEIQQSMEKLRAEMRRQEEEAKKIKRELESGDDDDDESA